MALANATLQLWVYTGEYSIDKPVSPQYTLYKDIVTGETEIRFEISELISDYIDITFNGSYDTATQSTWAEWTITRGYDDDTTDTEGGDPAPIKGSGIAWTGYGYFPEGINPDLIAASPIMMSNRSMYLPVGEKIYIPLYTEVDGVSKVEYYTGDTLVDSTEYTTTTSPLTADMTTITADSTLYTADQTLTVNTSSVQTTISTTNSGATSIKIYKGDTVIDTIAVNYINECKNTPYKIYFVNKYGVIQEIWMFGRRNDNVNITKDSYRRNTLDTTATSLTYSTTKSTTELYNFATTEGITLNTGFVSEEFKNVIKELLLSPHSWILENGVVAPIVPKTSSIEYKTQLYDKLINYTVDFEYAYNDVNIVR
jgi:hypothetical protein